MKKKKPYVFPTVISVKLDARQAVLSNRSVGSTKPGDAAAIEATGGFDYFLVKYDLRGNPDVCWRACID